MPRFNTPEEYYLHKGIPYEFPEGLTPSEIANRKLELMISVENEDDPVDYANDSQWKYEPWLSVKVDAKKPSGFGLSCDDCDCWDTDTYCGVRLSFNDRTKCREFVEHFIELYEQKNFG
jgi:hypothetical protein